MSDSRFFVARISGQDGPLSIEQIRAGLRSGRYKLTDLSWSEAAAGEWLPLGERPEFKLDAVAPVAAVDNEPAAAPAAAPRLVELRLPTGLDQPLDADRLELARRASIAWRRFLARNFDLSCCAALLLLLQPVYPQLLELQRDVLALIAIALWPWLEAPLIASFGTTPGKALLRLQVRLADGSRIGAQLALMRAIRVWVRGVGLGLPLINLLASMLAFNRFTRFGITSWDQDCGTRVEALPISQLRLGIIVSIFFASAALSVYVAVSGR